MLLSLLLAPAGALVAPHPRSRALSSLSVAAPVDLTNALPDCPVTKWNTEDIDLAAAQEEYKREGLPTCPLPWQASAEENAMGASFFAENREAIREKLLSNGCLYFKGFDLMKDIDGFRSFYEALDMVPSLDPIHTSGLRKFASAANAVYEEVNKKSLQGHYIGLHNESTKKKSSKYGAFVCFKPATISGGEFLIADGAKILRDLDLEILERFYRERVRISVSNLDLDFLDGLGEVSGVAKQAVGSLVDAAIAPKFDMDLEMTWGADGREGRLQAIEGKQSPVTRHPVTGKPVWFCNIHNHARALRDNRPCTVPEVGMTEVYWGDLTKIEQEVLDHVNAVSEASITRVPMQPGEVLLLDNYRVLHGRDIFEGDRFHAVSWLQDAADVGEIMGDGGAGGNTLNNFINTYVVGE